MDMVGYKKSNCLSQKMLDVMQEYAMKFKFGHEIFKEARDLGSYHCRKCYRRSY